VLIRKVLYKVMADSVKVFLIVYVDIPTVRAVDRRTIYAMEVSGFAQTSIDAQRHSILNPWHPGCVAPKTLDKAYAYLPETV